MKIYFQVLSSIVISLIAWSVVIGLPLVIFAVLNGKNNPLQILSFPFFVSFIGLVFYGFIGSLIWTIAYLLVKSINMSEFKKHIISASIAASIVPLFLSLAIFGLKIPANKVIDMYYLLALIIPIVIGSLFIYRKMYVKSNA